MDLVSATEKKRVRTSQPPKAGDNGQATPPYRAPRFPRTAPAAPRRPMILLKGKGTSPGIVIAPLALVRDHPLPEVTAIASTRTTQEEHQRLSSAIDQARRQIAKLRRKIESFPEAGRAEIGDLLGVYEHMLGRSRLLRGAHARLDAEPITAEAAIHAESEALAAITGPRPDLPDEERDAAVRRAGEVREIARRLLRNLAGISFRGFSNLPAGSILAVDQLRPSDAALINPAWFTAVLSESGGTTDHTAIMLRALAIPTVMAVSGLNDAAEDGDLAIIDGRAGTVTLNPDDDTLAKAHLALEAQARAKRGASRLRRLPARLAEGEEIALLANMELPNELPQVHQGGAQGVGLLRSEFLFGLDGPLPDEDAQYAVYASIVRGMEGHPVTIRVLDWGADKGIERLRALGYTVAEEEDGILGLRGLRLLLAHPDILETQFAAMLRASLVGPVNILLPMVTTLPEITRCREIMEKVARRLRRRGLKLPHRLPPLGVMIETPAAAITADLLVKHAEFLALGTNDLTMYTLAVDRRTTLEAELYGGLHPAVLRLIATAVSAGLSAHRPVSVCGEMASDPQAAALLIGMGVRSLSMTPSALPGVKKAIRGLSLKECITAQRLALMADDPLELREMLDRTIPPG